MSARESLAALLALHTLAHGNAEGWRCTCGHKGSREEYLSRAHVADAILAAGWTPPRTSNPDSHEWLGMDR